MQFHKEQAQWESDKSHLIQSKQEIAETNDRLTRKVEQLTKDNEKYKQELKANKKNFF